MLSPSKTKSLERVMEQCASARWYISWEKSMEKIVNTAHLHLFDRFSIYRQFLSPFYSNNSWNDELSRTINLRDLEDLIN